MPATSQATLPFAGKSWLDGQVALFSGVGGFDAPGDVQSDVECGCGLVSSHAGCGSREGAVDKGTEFIFEWLALADLDRLANNFSAAEFGNNGGVCGEPDEFADGGAFALRLAGEAEKIAALVLVIEGEVSVFLEDADFADAVLADPAGGDIGDAAVGKAEADIRDIFATAEHRDADRVDAFDGRLDKVEDDLDVVDHEVEHHTNVGAAVWVGGKAGDLEKSRVLEARFQGGESRVEALDVADLEDAATGGGKLRHFAGLFGRFRDGFFHEEVLAGGQQGHRDAVMSHRGRANRGSIDKAGKFLQGCGGPDTKFGGHGFAGFAVAVKNSRERSILEFRVDPGMVGSHVAHADNTSTKFVIHEIP